MKHINLTKMTAFFIFCAVTFVLTSVGGLLACSSSSTFEQQRATVVKFLKQINDAGNDFNNAFKAAGIDKKIASGNLLEINSALTTTLQQLEGYQQRVKEMSVPSGIPELAELKSSELAAAAKVYQVFQQLRSSIQSGNAAEVQRVALQLGKLSSDPDLKRSDQIEEALLAKYNIPDNEVNYSRQ